MFDRSRRECSVRVDPLSLQVYQIHGPEGPSRSPESWVLNLSNCTSDLQVKPSVTRFDVQSVRPMQVVLVPNRIFRRSLLG